MNNILSFFPLTIDNTMFAEYKKCPLSCYRKYIQHLQGGESIHLIAGKAFAAGLEAARKAYWNDGISPQDALVIGMEALEDGYGDFDSGSHVKSLDNMLLALDAYFIEYPLDADTANPIKLEDGTYGIEYSFVIELPIKHPDFDVPLLFVGRADALVKSQGKLWVQDEKTTGQITKNFAASWEMRSQFTGYCYGLKKNGIDVAGALVRGIAIQKTQIKFAEVYTKRSEYELHIWEKNFLEAVQGMVDFYKKVKELSPPHAAEIWPSSLGEGCMAYMSPCHYIDSCKSPKGEKFLAAEAGASQNIWLPHLQTRMPLREFLETHYPEALEN